MLRNDKARELNVKVVYSGPGLAGKTTNLQYVWDYFHRYRPVGQLISLATETDRVLFTDLGATPQEPKILEAFEKRLRNVNIVQPVSKAATPMNAASLDFGEIQGWKLRVHLCTTPGPVFYDESRRALLKGVDGVVFVADSQKERIEANIESMEKLKEHLSSYQYDLENTPLVLQYNKRDLKNVFSTRELQKILNPHRNHPWFEGVAATGIGVLDSLHAVVKLIRKKASLALEL